jgi:serine/threonine-protein kinase RsbW
MALRFSLTGTATDDGVRALLADCRRELEAQSTFGGDLGTVELVLAEALNNIAEHAYAQMPAGPVSIDLAVEGARLTIRLCDVGSALPNGRLPFGRRPEPTGPVDRLPEGGFGWFLIRDLCDRVEYHRIGGENHLLLVLSA